MSIPIPEDLRKYHKLLKEWECDTPCPYSKLELAGMCQGLIERIAKLEEERARDGQIILRISKNFARSEAAVSKLREENDKLRSFIAHSQLDCIYCGLPMKDMSKCELGFPGCGRADDMLCAPDRAALAESEGAPDKDDEPILEQGLHEERNLQ